MGKMKNKRGISALFQIFKTLPLSLKIVWGFALYDLTNTASNLFDPKLADFRTSAIFTIIIWSLTLFVVYKRNIEYFKWYRIGMGLYLLYYLAVVVANVGGFFGPIEDIALVVIMVISFIGLAGVYALILWNRAYFRSDKQDMHLDEERTHTPLSQELLKNIGGDEHRGDRSIWGRLRLRGFGSFFIILMLNHVVSMGIRGFLAYRFLYISMSELMEAFIINSIFTVVLAFGLWYFSKIVFFLIGKRSVFSFSNPHLKKNVTRLGLFFVAINILIFLIGMAGVVTIQIQERIGFGEAYRRYDGQFEQTLPQEEQRREKDYESTSLSEEKKIDNNSPTAEEVATVVYFPLTNGEKPDENFQKGREYFSSSTKFFKGNDRQNALTDAFVSLEYYKHPSAYLQIANIYIDEGRLEEAESYIYKAESLGFVYGLILNTKAYLASKKGDPDIARMYQSAGIMMNMTATIVEKGAHYPPYDIFYIGESIPYDSVVGEEGYVFSRVVESSDTFKSEYMMPRIGANSTIEVYQDLVIDDEGMPVDIEGTPQSKSKVVSLGDTIEIKANTLEYFYAIGQRDETSAKETYYLVYKVKYVRK